MIAYNHQPLLAGKYIVQCKRYSGSVGEPIIRDLFGVVMSERANKGILMTTGYFTRSAIAFAKDKQIELIDGAMLKELLQNNNISVKMDGFTKRKKQIGKLIMEIVMMKISTTITCNYYRNIQMSCCTN